MSFRLNNPPQRASRKVNKGVNEWLKRIVLHSKEKPLIAATLKATEDLMLNKERAAINNDMPSVLHRNQQRMDKINFRGAGRGEILLSLVESLFPVRDASFVFYNVLKSSCSAERAALFRLSFGVGALYFSLTNTEEDLESLYFRSKDLIGDTSLEMDVLRKVMSVFWNNSLCSLNGFMGLVGLSCMKESENYILDNIAKSSEASLSEDASNTKLAYQLFIEWSYLISEKIFDSLNHMAAFYLLLSTTGNVDDVFSHPVGENTNTTLYQASNITTDPYDTEDVVMDMMSDMFQTSVVLSAFLSILEYRSETIPILLFATGVMSFPLATFVMGLMLLNNWTGLGDSLLSKENQEVSSKVTKFLYEFGGTTLQYRTVTPSGPLKGEELWEFANSLPSTALGVGVSSSLGLLGVSRLVDLPQPKMPERFSQDGMSFCGQRFPAYYDSKICGPYGHLEDKSQGKLRRFLKKIFHPDFQNTTLNTLELNEVAELNLLGTLLRACKKDGSKGHIEAILNDIDESCKKSGTI
ncbi:hypothetical protein DID78_00355 [Candidatus Marinamargulisbacteria bacterium SCGC AG-343-D04]|nr:hypothetical protein DID78_00355 [Candidatus Marinamargulisbacteria bacterium SCGC AG-343-D04]